MAQEITITIDSILNGEQNVYTMPGEGQFFTSSEIDIDRDTSVTNSLPTGSIQSISSTERSTTAVDDEVIAIINTPLTETTFVILNNGKIFEYNVIFTTETFIGQVSGNKAQGAWYYNNFVYVSTDTDLSRFDPTNAAATLTNNIWTGTFGLTALTAPGITLGHWGHNHSDGAVYFCDFASGQGLIHKLQTTTAGANNGSAYSALDLPFSFVPTDIESYGRDLIISANVKGVSTFIRQGGAALFIWDTTDVDTFYRQIELAEYSNVTALYNSGGTVYVFSAPSNSGVDVGVYDGAYGVNVVKSLPYGFSPNPGAVGSYGGRIVFGGYTDVRALGYKNSALPKFALNNISNFNNETISALRYATQTSPDPVILFGTTGGSVVEGNKGTGGTGFITFGSFVIGQTFRIDSVRILLQKVPSGTDSLRPEFLFDQTNNYSLDDIDTTNFPNKRNIIYKQPELSVTKASINLRGENSFTFNLNFQVNSGDLNVLFPIIIKLHTIDD